MIFRRRLLFIMSTAAASSVSSVAPATAAPLAITLPAPVAPTRDGFNMGTARRPDGTALTLDSASLRWNDEPWAPVMGEFHYARYPANEWREELLKMKAGGIDIVATYVFWIHHEEIEGEWDWSGQRNLREFVRLCGEVGLTAVVRCGPWCHGEVRNGGIPEWAIGRSDWRQRSRDAGFLARVHVLYAQIAQQLDGLLWKQGGPVIGVQVDNEWGGPAAYLLDLKNIAREVGLDVPLYTRTGWPQLSTPMPFGEIVPLYGAYAEGFWDRELTSMPGRYWAAFRFSTLRIDDNIANEQLGRREAQDAPDVARYPYLTCEMGGGMMNSYHRRILIAPADVEVPILVKLGSGSTLPGYYMYHGGTNPEGKRTTLMEAQDTPLTNWNDMPVKNYDFQGLLGEYGQIRPHYHFTRRLHLFLDDFGAALARMPATMPDARPQGRDDTTTLRWAARSDGSGGFIFVSNYERSRALPPKDGVQFALQLADGTRRTIPAEPVTVPADARFIWPFNLELGHGVRLDYATAQPVCAIDDGGGRTIFFAETPGVPAEFAIVGAAAPQRVRPGAAPALVLPGSDGGSVRIVLLDEASSLGLYRGTWLGRDRIFHTNAGLVVDGDAVRLTSTDPGELTVGVYPAPAELATRGRADGIFVRFAPKAPRATAPQAAIEVVQSAGPAREIPLGPIRQPVAAQPTEADFAHAAVWRITLPRDLDLSTDPLLRFHYVGDVARVTLNGRLVTDDFYNGNFWEIGLRRHAPEILDGELRLAILPLRADALAGERQRIFMADSARPEFAGADQIVRLDRVTIVPRYSVSLGATP